MYYKQLSLEKEMYQTQKGFLSNLEEMDPTHQYKGTEIEGLDAFERQLYRFGIQLKGSETSQVGSFFESSQTAVLFPEYVHRAVAAGMEQAGQLSQIVAARTMIEGRDYRPIAVEVKEEDRITKEGEKLPETQIVSQPNLVNLKKRGRLLSASYEAVRFQRLEVFTAMLRQIGASIARSQMADAIDVLLNGDGNKNKAEIISASGSLAYSDLLNLWGSFDDTELTTIVCGSNVILKMAEMEEFKNPLTGLNFASEGSLSTPLGANLIKSNDVPENKIIGLDKHCSLEQICVGNEGLVIDYDKLIDHQFERAAITSISGFAKIFPSATKVLEFV